MKHCLLGTFATLVTSFRRILEILRPKGCFGVRYLYLLVNFRGISSFWFLWSHEWTGILDRMGSSHSSCTSCRAWSCRGLGRHSSSWFVAFHGRKNIHHRICNNRIVRNFCTFPFWICGHMGLMEWITRSGCSTADQAAQRVISSLVECSMFDYFRCQDFLSISWINYNPDLWSI